MSRRKRKSKTQPKAKSSSRSKPKTKSGGSAHVVSQQLGRKEPEDEDFLTQVRRNRIGYIGFILSMLQLLVHGSWMLFAAYLSSVGVANDLDPNSWQMWLIVMLMLTGAVLTVVSLYQCSRGAIYGNPKTLAIVGAAVSFFIGMLTSSVVLLNIMAPK